MAPSHTKMLMTHLASLANLDLSHSSKDLANSRSCICIIKSWSSLEFGIVININNYWLTVFHWSVNVAFGGKRRDKHDERTKTRACWRASTAQASAESSQLSGDSAVVGAPRPFPRRLQTRITLCLYVYVYIYVTVHVNVNVNVVITSLTLPAS